MSSSGVSDKPRQESTPGLGLLLGIGVVGVAAGVIAIIVSSTTAVSGDGPSAATAIWNQLGSLLVTAGILGVVGHLAAVAVIFTIRDR